MTEELHVRAQDVLDDQTYLFSVDLETGGHIKAVGAGVGEEEGTIGLQYAEEGIEARRVPADALLRLRLR